MQTVLDPVPLPENGFASRRDRLYDLFTNNRNKLLRPFLDSQPQENGVDEAVVGHPLGKLVNLTWATSTGLTQWQRLMTAGVKGPVLYCSAL